MRQRRAEHQNESHRMLKRFATDFKVNELLSETGINQLLVPKRSADRPFAVFVLDKIRLNTKEAVEQLAATLGVRFSCKSYRFRRC